jgi:hypothetical protein
MPRLIKYLTIPLLEILKEIFCECRTHQVKLLHLLGKMPHKENSRENSRPRAGFNGRYEVVQEEERTKGKGFRPGMAFYRRGRVRG